MIVIGLQSVFNRLFKDKALIVIVLSTILGYFLYFLILSFLGKQSRDWTEYLYLFLVYSFSTYTYFHIFNMSETARRIRLLFAVARNQTDFRETEDLYEESEMIEIRLKRLESLKQIKRIGDRVYPANLFFTVLSYTIYKMSVLMNREWIVLKKKKE